MSGPPTLAAIVRALGGELYAGGRRASVPGPGHSPADRSVSLLLSGDRVVVHSFAGEDWRVVLADLESRGLVDRTGRLIGSATGGPAPPLIPLGRRLAAARQLWSEARPLAGTLSARHLALRAVRPPSEGLRHHPAAPMAIYAEAGDRRPALLAAIRRPDGELAGVEVTYLAADGGRARVRLPRKTVGLRPAGSAVRLAPAGPRLLVGEGVFTCLSAAEVFDLPAWALLTADNLRSWRPPSEVDFVLVAGDRGQVGETAAFELSARLAASGVRSNVRLPPAPFGDWNEARALGAGGEGTVGSSRG